MEALHYVASKCCLCGSRAAVAMVDATWLPTGRRAKRYYCRDAHCYGQHPYNHEGEKVYWKIHERVALDA